MWAVGQVEDEILRGQDDKQSTKTVPLFANLDVHDGQVLIDLSTKTVTLLDFGQALPITNAERGIGITLLRAMARLDSSKSAARMLREALLLAGVQVNNDVPESGLTRALSGDDQMDRSFRSIVLLNRIGVKVEAYNAARGFLRAIGGRGSALLSRVGTSAGRALRCCVSRRSNQ